MRMMKLTAAAGTGTVAAVVALGLGLSAQTNPAAQKTAPKPALAVAHKTAQPAAAPAASTPQPDLTKQYCIGCHSDKGKAGGLSLVSFDPSHADQNAEVSEKIIRKLRLGMMPPPGMRRPDAAVLLQFATSLESKVDAAAAVKPNPGRRPFQRLNRAEYEHAVRDLLDLDVDVNAFLPPDTLSAGYDNIADVQTFSATLMEGYLRAAARISTLAVGDRNASPSEFTVKIPRTESQMRHVDGTPWGTRGGLALDYTFPADGDYTFRVMLHGTPTGQLFGSVASRNEQIDLSINGERVALLDVDWKMTETDKNGLNLVTPRVHVKAGPQHIAAAFIQKFDGVVDDLVSPIDYTLADTEYGDNAGITILPHVRDFSITGPFKVTGVSDTPSRRKVFICRPTSPADEIPCARRILSSLAGEAYRRAPNSEDVESLMEFYGEARKGHDFEAGIKAALQALLASPKFVFRFESTPTLAKAGQTYRISDIDLASRLSFFLWNTVPDAELVKVATANTLHTPTVLDKQVKRMLADSRAESLSTRFASQWLRLQDVEKIHPDALLFPGFDNELAASYKRETELFFNSIVQEDRSILDLLTADYTFVNERIARVYGMPNIVGENFRRVTVPDERRGILGQGSMLMQTAVADRTSPVQRGKWIMEVMLGSPPPPPPADVPPFDDTKAATATGKPLSTRERMEEHRKNPACQSCHKVIDPLGLALDNFDTLGAYRIKDNGVAIDSNGVMYDGTKLTGPADLRNALLNHSEGLIRNFTDNLMSYAIGRRIEYYDQPSIRAITRKAAQNGNHFSSFVLGIVNSPAFQMSTAEAVTTTAQ
jgi:mono/diheme cytochrome c family protein